MNVPAAAGILRAPLRHEARHNAEAVADFLRRGLEQHRAVSRFEGFRVKDRSFVDAGAGFGMQALDRNAEERHFLHQRFEKRWFWPARISE